MCGICGILNHDGTLPDLAALGRMTARLARRGPDHQGSWSDGPLALGHRRLSIIDLDAASHQPLVDPVHNRALVFNGVIYNYVALRRELSALGHRFLTRGDSEVILKAYAQWGEDCLPRLDGIFAFAIWDMHRRELFLARDRLGVKPLYFSSSGQRFLFASSLPALLAAGGVDSAIDPIALHHHLTLHAVVPAPRTVLRGARKLAPGNCLTLGEDGRQRQRTWWQLDARRPDTPPSEGEWLEQTSAHLRDAIRRQLAATDVPLGVLLSGGLDSSLLVALAAEIGGSPPRTFSIGFEDTPEEAGSEFFWSDQVAERYRTRHTRYAIPNAEVLPRLPEAVTEMSEPMVGQDAVAFYLLAERVSLDVRVVLSGQGADEVFGGYFWYPRMQAASGTALARFAPHYFDRDHAEYLATVTPPHHTGDVTAELVAEELGRPGADEFLDQVLRFDVSCLIVDDPVKRVDNMTMAWGLEARVPFLDHRLVAFAASMPPALKLAEEGKHPLKAMARPLLPSGVIDRPKGYFPMPALKYVRGDFLAFMADTLNSRACRERKLFQRPCVERLLAAPEAHYTPLNGSKLWHLALLELWLQRVVDGAPGG